MLNYESMVVLPHFKGHAIGGVGGSMKNIAIIEQRTGTSTLWMEKVNDGQYGTMSE